MMKLASSLGLASSLLLPTVLGFVPLQHFHRSSTALAVLAHHNSYGQRRHATFSSSSTALAAAVSASESSQLYQLAQITTLSIDSGDLKVIEEYAKTGLITDATTNPLFVSQAGLSGDPTYAEVRMW